MDEWIPEPLEQGWREPPRRRPPTAVGVATPPPPRGPLSSRYGESRLRRVRRALGQILVSVSLGLAAGAFVETPVLIALLFGFLGVRAAWRRRSRALQRATGFPGNEWRRAA
jgi:hypothetical protein